MFGEIFNMKTWLLIILLVIMCSVAASMTQQVSGQYGSDLHFPLSQLCQEPFIDIYAGETLIGNYVNHILEDFKKFKDRLQFDQKSCTFKIKDFSEVDGHHFTFTNYGPKIRMDFKVFVSAVGDTTDEYTSEECISGLVALGFSLDPIICLIFIILAKKMKEKRWNDAEIGSCMKQAVISFIGKDKNWINFACISIKVVSLACQIVSLISLVCCGRIDAMDCLFIPATAFTVIGWFFAAGYCCIHFTSKCNKGKLNPRDQSFCYVLEVAQSLAFLLFLAFIYCLYFSQYGVNSTDMVWVLVASPLISIILKIVIFILCRKYWPEEKKY
ncbi:uncharacterized protein LOC120924585 [Rana temporaria]|uniref:uncharacterized protein LOC120924585 n=1 Tax=Rana temporaria TaxID=8407 RepID=UPI001AADB96B|nr:uncharacterized protein LOC120924585 [Rana temporaria]